ncbi:MAG: hypothetical protein JXQ29_08935, partial [Planctomycetes bacterium]|nr:hypothetical protein [Planctomycetota bacterium]
MSDPAPLLECHRCGAGFDVAGLKPDARFRCEACGAWLRVPRPKRRAPWIAVACAASAIAGAAIVYLLASTGGAPPPAPTPASTPAPAPAPETARPAAAPAATAPDRPAEAPAQPEADPLALEFEALRERTRSGRILDLLAFARFCRLNERYVAEAEQAF